MFLATILSASGVGYAFMLRWLNKDGCLLYCVHRHLCANMACVRVLICDILQLCVGGSSVLNFFICLLNHHFGLWLYRFAVFMNICLNCFVGVYEHLFALLVYVNFG